MNTIVDSVCESVQSSLGEVSATRLGHSNLIFCFTSRISSKSDSVGRVIFVNVSYEYHYRNRNFNFYMQARNHKPQTTNAKNQLKLYFSPLARTTLPRFTSALTHNRSTISGSVVLV